ncbi:phosphatidylinositol N-acetylglucosaminyltransferase subunit GPI1 [Verticillium dahliae VdLs.17]|uniref:Phosphatidylinositol N-acetylglucosaminyltransferase subunit GPI1 n=1 Tax=Verticillium dahliae (strain VdLs.17 / ATCC MYA-4575 / FGSC 10137) TaxID=498257 RepID=G2WSR1_VERDV|nr:phosphatidylinositol N-acetylglucosaminyltransferase subunit GPI1 [Verticillium dahliae VdLs.17]EGY17160.1 phosphatidylinositol N-acetylglucosaminyltransferase subunit GPI1 [Verticillium dahliae VdLs.17]KAH6701750.1 phosphatidylinositol N-acetylglucosaminyltransferase subunit GPI1 [Verticillium dahliae]
MHPLSVVSFAIFVAGYITARWDLVTRLYELAIFAWDHGVVQRAAKGFALLTLLYCFIFIPVERLATREATLAGFVLIALHELATVMQGSDGLMRIFWPTDIQRSELSGVVVGWRNSPLDVFVVAVLDHVDPGHVEFAFKVGTLFRNSPHPVSHIYERCGHASMHVLGLTNAGEDVVLDPFLISAVTASGCRVPQITCAKATSIQIILYDRPLPSKMQYISLRPISLALGDNAPSAEEVESELEHERLENRQKEQKRKLVEKLKQHIIVKRSPSLKEKALPKIISQVNWAYELERLLQKNVSRIGTRPKRALSVSERVAEHAETMRNYVWDLVVLYLFPVIQWGFVYMLMGHRAVAEVLLRILEWRARPHYAALKDISATAQQVEIRLQQFCYWPIQYRTLRQRKDNWESITTSHPDYIRFYNSLWLVANDVIIGIALGSYIIDNGEWVAGSIAQLLQTYTVEALRRSISWLMGYPAGLKLNRELALFLGDLFLWVIEYWSGCIVITQKMLPHVVWFVGFSSFAGASMPIAVVSDLLSLLTVHIHCFYMASARIFHWQLTILISLFHLFRGKKHNILRNRIDSCDYDLDQLLVGTILFTVLFFLLPTVVVFYLNFAVARMVIISLKAVLDTLLSCLNHFPLFALMLRVKDPGRLPGGIRYELRNTVDVRSHLQTSSQTPTSVIYLKPIPLTFGAMFHQYFQMGNRIRKHYLSPRVLFSLLTGQFVPPINRRNLYSLQYSMLPNQRPTIREMWNAVTAPSPGAKKPVPFIVNGRRYPSGPGGGGRARYH